MINNNFHKVAGPFSLEILAKLVNAKICGNNKGFSGDKYLIYGAADIEKKSAYLF